MYCEFCIHGDELGVAVNITAITLKPLWGFLKTNNYLHYTITRFKTRASKVSVKIVDNIQRRFRWKINDWAKLGEHEEGINDFCFCTNIDKKGRGSSIPYPTQGWETALRNGDCNYCTDPIISMFAKHSKNVVLVSAPMRKNSSFLTDRFLVIDRLS